MDARDNIALKVPFWEKELKAAIFGSEAIGAPGLDDFSFLFYLHFLDLVKHNLLSVLSHFYNHTLNVAKLNHAMVCLIPKE